MALKRFCDNCGQPCPDPTERNGHETFVEIQQTSPKIGKFVFSYRVDKITTDKTVRNMEDETRERVDFCLECADNVLSSVSGQARPASDYNEARQGSATGKFYRICTTQRTGRSELLMYLRTSVDHSKYINTQLVREWAIETVPVIDSPNDLTESYALIAVYSEAHTQTVTIIKDREDACDALDILMFMLASRGDTWDRPIYRDENKQCWETM